MSDKDPLVPTNNPPPPAYTSAPTAPPPGYQYGSPIAPPPPPPGNQYGTTTNVTVVSTQPVRTYPVQGPPPRSYLVLAIISLIFGFWPLGIVAILFSVRSMNAYSAGNHELGFFYARKARLFGLLGIVIGTVIYILVVILAVVSVAIG